jgi:hypothetical protein
MHIGTGLTTIFVTQNQKKKECLLLTFIPYAGADNTMLAADVVFSFQLRTLCYV